MPQKGNAVNITILSVLILIAVAKINLPINAEVKEYLGYPTDSLLNFTELTAKYGYNTQEHTVITEDGYVLKLFRIVKNGKCFNKSLPVVLMHGLLLSADAWIDAGPGAGLAYLIADDCHDLWVANCRGNYYSRAHTTLDPDKDAEFWSFTPNEIGVYDVPAIIDYVLDQTGEDKLNYIGYSQGAGTFFIMCSERTGYCDKVNVLIALAPASRQVNTRSVIYRTFTKSMLKLEGMFFKFGVQEVLSKGAGFQEFLAFFCQLNLVTEKLCWAGQGLFDSFHPKSVKNTTTRALFGHFPAGTSVHSLAWYGQSMDCKDFRKFDYGADNIRLYGSEEPPKYNLSAVSVPVVAIYGQNDGLVDTKDVQWLMKKLPNVVEAWLVRDPKWNHFDVTYSQYTGDLMYPKIRTYLRYNFSVH
ncbi:lipase 1-like [Plodia interpunctella]|uniref:lipase 1-like n=1 Tax=Plodia interpunctella TaxID=58824 RepID=UPI002367B1B8|nr:lipase 1-like [Plodia interpunctella]